MKRFLIFPAILMMLFFTSCNGSMGGAVEEEAFDQTVSGTFTLASGDPMSSGSVTFHDIKSAEVRGTAATGGDGSFVCDTTFEDPLGIPFDEDSVTKGEEEEIHNLPRGFVSGIDRYGTQYIAPVFGGQIASGSGVIGNSDSTSAWLSLLMGCDSFDEEATPFAMVECIQDIKLRDIGCMIELDRLVSNSAEELLGGTDVLAGAGALVGIKEMAKDVLLEWGRSPYAFLAGTLCIEDPDLCEELFAVIALRKNMNAEEIADYFTAENGADVVGKARKDWYHVLCKQGLDLKDEAVLDAIHLSEHIVLYHKPHLLKFE